MGRGRHRAGGGVATELLRDAGAEENAFPLYSFHHATWLRSRILAVFEAADRDPTLIERGALNFVIVGGGATGVEMAGALADMIARTMTAEYHHLEVSSARIHLVDLGHHLLGPFSPKAHEYAERVLRERGVRASPRHQGDGGRDGPRHSRRRHHDQDEVRGLGAEGSRRRRWLPRPACRRAEVVAST